MNNIIKGLFSLTLLASASAQAAYVMYIPTEVKLRGSLPDGTIQFVTPNEEPTEPVEPEEPTEPTYRGSVTFSTIYKSTKTGSNFKTILLGYNARDYSSNNSELPNREAYPCDPAITSECVTVNDPYVKGAYSILYSGSNTVITYTYASLNKIPNQIDMPNFRTSYNTIYVEQNGEMLGCGKSGETFATVGGSSNKHDEYNLSFTCSGNITLPLSNVTFRFN
ncbi:hypothetical protein ACNE9Y_30110 [Pseudomonas sp. NY11226]|uniref:hypothetical protein n=1 Tax=unclassified Pseudomonas TaxID=196821 RepID=UPI0031F6AAD2